MSIDQIKMASGMGVEYTHLGTSILKIAPSGVTIGGGILGQAKFALGTPAAPSISFTEDPDTGIYSDWTNTLSFCAGGARHLTVHGTGITVLETIYLGNGEDVVFGRDAANVLAQKNGTNAQEFRVYGTTTGNKYLGIKHDGTNGKILCDEDVYFRVRADNAMANLGFGLATLCEVAAPTAPGDGYLRLYAKDAGGGKTGLYVLFPTGVEQQIKVEA